MYIYICTALMRPKRPKQYCLQLVIYICMYVCKWQVFSQNLVSVTKQPTSVL